MKSILVIGLGRFGATMAVRLSELENEVLAIDVSEERVNEIAPHVTSAQIGDCTREPLIASLGVRNFDLCVVAIGDNFQSSLEITALLKDHGAKFVLARANRDVHAKFLLRNGADRIAYPERETAIHLAELHSADSVFDFIQLNEEYAIFEIETPDGWVGHSIVELNVRAKLGINILAVKRGALLEPNPTPGYRFSGEETLILMGRERDIKSVLNR